MFKTETLLRAGRAATAVTLLIGVSAVSGQTIEEIAEAQRAKVQLEIAKGQPSKEPVRAAAPEPAKRKAETAATIILHAVYENGDGFIAEVTDGTRLARLSVGMRHANAVVSRVDQKGVHLTAPMGCKVRCPQDRLITVGGTF